jgi:hypothetical protein
MYKASIVCDNQKLTGFFFMRGYASDLIQSIENGVITDHEVIYFSTDKFDGSEYPAFVIKDIGCGNDDYFTIIKRLNALDFNTGVLTDFKNIELYNQVKKNLRNV